MDKFLVTIGGPRTHEEPEHYAMAVEETLKQTVENAARDNPERLDAIHVWCLAPMRVTAKAFAVLDLERTLKQAGSVR